MRSPSQILSIMRAAMQDPHYVNMLPIHLQERFTQLTSEGALPAPGSVFEAVLDMLSVAISDSLRDQLLQILESEHKDLRDAP